jgi:hypothetical protein
MDAGSYRFTLGQFKLGLKKPAPYVPFNLTSDMYYIPRLPQTTYPRWLVVCGSYVTSAGKNLGSAYIVFAQNSPGANWMDVNEPDILPGRTPPQVATGGDGYAQSVTAAGAGLSVSPEKIRQLTTTWLDQVAANPSDKAVAANEDNLTDLRDEVYWRSGQVGAALHASDTHSVPPGPVFALRTTDGGALLFYTTFARLTLTPPAGTHISEITIPGYYSPASSAGQLTAATVGYVEQFATYVPAVGHGGRQIVADTSSIASRG